MHCIEKQFEQETPSHINAKVFGGAAIVHALPVDNTEKFREYSDTIFITWTVIGLTSFGTRTDLTDWKPQPEKNEERAHAEKNFAGFLQHATNKEELFNLVTIDVIKHDQVNMCTLLVVHM